MAKEEEELKMVQIDKDALANVSEDMAENFRCILTQVPDPHLAPQLILMINPVHYNFY
jgi:hypothetical protein